MNAQVEEWVSYAHEDLEVAQHASRAGVTIQVPPREGDSAI